MDTKRENGYTEIVIMKTMVLLREKRKSIITKESYISCCTMAGESVSIKR